MAELPSTIKKKCMELEKQYRDAPSPEIFKSSSNVAAPIAADELLVESELE